MFRSMIYQLTLIALFLLITGGFLILAMQYPALYVSTTYEDLLAEWGQFYFYLAGLVLSVPLAVVRGHYRWFFAVLALACFYAAGEEISWGQRIFEYEVPEIFEEQNLQNETNLHNFLTGPESGVRGDIVKYAVILGVLCYGVLFPWLLGRGARLSRLLVDIGVAPPPRYLAPYFLAAGVLEIGLFHFNEAEVAEVLLGFAIGVIAIHHGFSRNRTLEADLPESWPASAQLQVAGRLVALFLLVVTLAGASTYAAYQAPSMRAGIENRLVNGFEKYAAAYAIREHWKQAAQMYFSAHELSRDLAGRYRLQGNSDWARFYEQKAYAFSLRVLEADPDSVVITRALIRFYRERGDIAKVEYLSQRVQELGGSSAETVE